MKRVWIVAALALVILSVGCGALVHLSYVTKEMEASLEKIVTALSEEDGEVLPSLVQDFQTRWEENESAMMRYIHHDELDTITGIVARLNALARYGEFAELAAETERLRHLIHHIYESELPTFENII